MGMVVEWMAVDPAEGERLRVASDDEFVRWLTEDATRFDVDKTWQAVHVSLTGGTGPGDPPLGWAVLGGEPFGEDQGYGPARLLAAEQVRAVADALDELGTEGFAARVDPDRLRDLDVYPSGVWRKADEWLPGVFDEIHDFYRRAAGAGQAVILRLG